MAVAAGPTVRALRAPGLVVKFSLVTAVVLVAALRLPAETTVLGLAVFGILHNVLELRYVTGRFDTVLTGPFLGLVLTLITGIVLCRLLSWMAWSRPTEILLAYVVLAVACAWRLRGPLLVAAFALLAGAAVASLNFPAFHFVVLTHLHNVVPLFFLWEWARDLPQGRTAFRAIHLGWIVVIPALILAGVFDPWISGGPSTVSAFVGSTHHLAASYALPGASTYAMRFLTVFAFMAMMHYLVWVWFMPRHAPDAAARFDSRVTMLRGKRAWVLGIAGTALLAVLFATDYASGYSLYSAVASYHAYLEFPVMLALVLGMGRPTARRHRTEGALA